MKLSKKRKRAINSASVFDDLLWKFEVYTNHNPTHWWHSPPETWNEDEKQLFDLVCGIEDKLKEEILKIIER